MGAVAEEGCGRGVAGFVEHRVGASPFAVGKIEILPTATRWREHRAEGLAGLRGWLGCLLAAWACSAAAGLEP